MTAPASPPGHRDQRALGWDIDSSFSSNRGELLPIGSFGHTGFTGTSIWIDPATQIFIVFLSNRVHPDGKGDVTPLRAKVATAVAAALVEISGRPAESHPFPPVRCSTGSTSCARTGLRRSEASAWRC
jgi:CubicO group peptidase (beta-lactamase class C family)